MASKKDLQDASKALNEFSGALKKQTNLLNSMTKNIGDNKAKGKKGSSKLSWLSKAKERKEKIRNWEPFQMLGLDKKVKERRKDYDNITAGIAKATGMGNMYNKTLRESFKELHKLGISFKEASNLIDPLHKNMSGFSDMLNKRLQHELLTTVGTLHQLGIDATTSGKLMDIFTKSLGKGMKPASNFLNKIAQVALELKVPLKDAFADFSSNIDRYIVYGANKALKVFTNLQAIAKQTGISMSSLHGSIGKGLDTYEGAAKFAGRLNAVLKTNISTVGLLAAKENERILIVKRALESTGKTFDEMGKYQQITIAKEMGMKVNELGKLMGKTSFELELAQAKTAMGMAGPATPKVEKAAAASVKVEEALKTVGDRLMFTNRLFPKFTKEVREVHLTLLRSLNAIKSPKDALKVAFGAIGKVGALKGQFAVTAGFKAIDQFLGPSSAKLVGGITNLTLQKIKGMFNVLSALPGSIGKVFKIIAVAVPSILSKAGIDTKALTGGNTGDPRPQNTGDPRPQPNQFHFYLDSKVMTNAVLKEMKINAGL